MDWNTLPDNLPVPVDDGAADHLKAQRELAEIAHINLPATSGPSVNIYTESFEKPVLLFIYPRTGQPGVPNPKGWDDIPGARGCTPVRGLTMCFNSDISYLLIPVGIMRYQRFGSIFAAADAPPRNFCT
jgi:hypothetical protein